MANKRPIFHKYAHVVLMGSARIFAVWGQRGGRAKGMGVTYLSPYNVVHVCGIRDDGHMTDFYYSWVLTLNVDVYRCK